MKMIKDKVYFTLKVSIYLVEIKFTMIFMIVLFKLTSLKSFLLINYFFVFRRKLLAFICLLFIDKLFIYLLLLFY